MAKWRTQRGLRFQVLARAFLSQYSSSPANQDAAMLPDRQSINSVDKHDGTTIIIPILLTHTIIRHTAFQT